MTRWTTSNHDTYATLHRDGSDIPTARFHVIAGAEASCAGLPGAEGMRAALIEARQIVAEDRADLVEGDTIPDANEWRDESTMDPMTQEAVAEIDAVLSLIDAALKEDTNA